MSALAHDLLLALRSLARRPGYTVMAVAVLAAGVGGATATFGLLRAVFLRPLPVQHLEGLVAVFRTDLDDAGRFTGFELVSYPEFLDLASRTMSQVELAVHQRQAMSLSGSSEPARIVGMFVSANYFDLLGLRPAAGRFFTPQEGLVGRPQSVVVLSHGAWHRWFAGDPGVLHRQLRLNGHPLEIVGVAPAGFQGTELTHGADLWVPLPLFRQLSPYGARLDDREFSLFYVLGRLRPGARRDPLQAAADATSRQLAQEYPPTDAKEGFSILPLAGAALGATDRSRYTGFAKTVAATFGLLLLAACVTVANLLLMRGVEARRDLAVRQALGAGRMALIRVRACEALVLFLLGGLASVPAGRALALLLWRLRPPELAQATLDLGADASILAFALLLTAATAAIFGVAPVVRGLGSDLQATLRVATASGASGQAGSRRARLSPSSLMVMGQVGLALAVLIAAALCLRSLVAAARVDLLYVALVAAPGDRHLGTVRHYLTLGEVDFALLLDEMTATEGCFGLIRRGANRIRQKEARLLSGVLVSTHRHTELLDSPRLLATLTRSTFQVADLKRSPHSLYLVLPPHHLQTHGRWLRLLVASALRVLTASPGRPASNVLFLLDEFPVLGRMQVIEEAIAYARSYGISIWMLIQDLSQLRQVYGTSWETLLANTRIKQAFGTADEATADYLSRLTGQATVRVETMNQSRGSSSGQSWLPHRQQGMSQNFGETARRLLLPDEIRRLPADRQLLFLSGELPLLTQRVDYRQRHDLQSRADPNPVYAAAVPLKPRASGGVARGDR